jgi:hypothetical protein
MAPLPDKLKIQTVAAAATIEAQAAKTAGLAAPRLSTSPGIVPGFTNPDAPGSTGAGAGGAATNSGGGANAQTTGAAAPGDAAKVPTVAQQPVAGARRTPALTAPAVGALLLTILICGALAAAFSPILQSPVIHRLGTAIRRLGRREVTPTEQ